MQSALNDLIKKGEESPYYKLLDMKIDEVKENYAKLSIKIDRRHLQLLNTVHGGVIAGLADSAAAWAIFGSNNLEGALVTIEMKINFLKPVSSGRLIAEARSVHRGSRIYVCDVDVTDDNGTLVAKSLVTYYLVKSS